MSRKQSISSCQCCVYTPLPSWKTPRVDEINTRLIRFDADAKGLIVPASSIVRSTFLDGANPSAEELSQSIAASILDGRVSAELFADVLLFAHGEHTVNAGYWTSFTPRFQSGVSNVEVRAYVPLHQEGPPSHYNYSQYRLGGIGGQVGLVASQFEPVGNRGISGFFNLEGGGLAFVIYQAPHYRPTFFRNPPPAVRQGLPEWEAVGDNDGAGWPPVPNDVIVDIVLGDAIRQIATYTNGTNERQQISLKRNTASTVFANRFWALNGNVFHSRCQSCVDFFVTRFRLMLGDQQRLWMPPGSHNSAFGDGAIVTTRLSNGGIGFATTAYVTTVSIGGETANVSTPAVKIAATPTQQPSTVLATAYARTIDDGSLPSLEWNGASRMGLLYSNARTNAEPGFSQQPLAGVESVGALSIYRNGSLVATIANTSKAQQWRSAAIEEATTEEGSYLLVGDNTADDADGAMYVLGSIVIDKTPPIGVVKQTGDFYVGDPTGLLPEWGAGFNFGNTPEMFRCVEESEPCSVGGRNWINVADGGGVANPATLPVGEYAFRQSGPLRDRAGNSMPHLPELRFNVRPLPPSGEQFGPVAEIILPENNRGTFASAGSVCRSLLYDHPILSFAIRFDRPVNKLSVRHFRLERRNAESGWEAIDLPLSGDPPTESSAPDLTPDERSVLTGNVVIAKKSAKEYTLTFPQGVRVFSKIEQLPNSIFTLTFDPRFVTGNDAIQVLDDAGQVITDQKCDLATRVMWGIMPEAGKNLERINVKAIDHNIDGVSSVTQEISIAESETPSARPRQIAIETTEDVTLSPISLKVAEVEACRPFVPRVPPHPYSPILGNATNYGFFGVGSSIHPAPPASIPPCSAPSAPQPHSSAICSDGEIVGWNVTFRTESGMWQSSIDAAHGFADYLDGQKNVFPQARTVQVLPFINYYNSLMEQAANSDVGKEPGPSILDPPVWYHFEGDSVPKPEALQFSTNLSGYACQQNVWSLTGLAAYQGWLSVSRAATEYPSLKTAFLWRPTISIRGYYAKTSGPHNISASVSCAEDPFVCESVGGNQPFGGGVYEQWTDVNHNWVPFYLNPIKLSPSQEIAIGSGSPVEIAYSSSLSNRGNPSTNPNVFSYGGWGGAAAGAASYLLANDLVTPEPAGGGIRPAQNNQTDLALANYMFAQIQTYNSFYVTLTPIFA